MLTKAQQYFSEICRLCLMEPQDLELNTMSLQLKLKYSEILSNLTEIKIPNENNLLPKGVCHECSGKLIQFFKFKKQIELSYNKLCEVFEINNRFQNNIIIKNFKFECDNEIKSSTTSSTATYHLEPTTTSSFNINDEYKVPEIKENLNEEQDCESMESEIEELEEEEVEYIIDDYQTGAAVLDMKDEEIEYIEEDIPNLKLDNEFPSDNLDCEEYNFLAVIEDNHQNDSNQQKINTSVEYKEVELSWSNKLRNSKKPENKKSIDFDISPETIPSDTLMQKLINEYGVIKGDSDANGKDIISYYGCKLCDENKTFKSQGGLSAHLLVHTGLRPFECELCSKSFSQRSHLSAHIKIHEGFRPYSCEICGRTFNKSSNLIRHKKIHNNEAEYPCNYCPKRFKWKSSLEVHTYSHTGEKPYGCHICNKVYTSDASLRKHCKRNHLGKGIKPLESEY